MALVRWRVHGSTPHEDNLDHVLGRRERMWREGVSQERAESGGSWTGRDRLTLCPIRVYFDDRMLCPWDVGNQGVLLVVTSPGHWLLLTPLSNTEVSLRGAQTQEG